MAQGPLSRRQAPDKDKITHFFKISGTLFYAAFLFVLKQDFAKIHTFTYH